MSRINFLTDLSHQAAGLPDTVSADFKGERGEDWIGRERFLNPYKPERGPGPRQETDHR